jgi:hypothetical protein
LEKPHLKHARVNRRASPQRKQPADAAVDKLAPMIEAAKTVAIFGGDD